MRTEFNTGWEVRAPQGPFAVLNEAAATTTAVTLPHDALRDADRSAGVPGAGAAAYFPPGAYTYLKSFDVPTEWAGRIVRLEFGGVMRHAMIFVNDELAGNRADGYARFWVDVTPYLRFGAVNQLRVEVRTIHDSRWYSGAGLIRGVGLQVDEPVHISPDGVSVTTVRLDEDQAVVEVATRTTNAGLTTAEATLTTVIEAPDASDIVADTVPVTIPPGETCLVRQRFYLPQPELWSDERPALHRARVVLSAPGTAGPTETTVTFGVRTIAADPVKGLLLNGRPVLLRGACIHHDNGSLGAAAVPRAEERRVELLKAAGFNAIRSAHNPASDALLDACDRLGVLVMDEAFDMWVRGKTPYDYANDFPQWWQDDLSSMVAKDRNHPSVIMYSLGNEIVEIGTPHGAHLARRMAEHVRALDPSRLVTSGMNLMLAILDELGATVNLNEGMAAGTDDVGAGMGLLASSDSATRRTAETCSVLDVVGLNYGEPRYPLDRAAFPRRVIVGSESFPPEIGRLWPMVVDNPNVVGDFTWTGWDYLGEVGIGSTFYADQATGAGLEREFPWLAAWCGDLDLTGWRRPLSYYREIVFGLRAEPYLAVVRPDRRGQAVTMASPWAWSDSVASWTWPGFEGQPVEVEVYADADEVALLLDGVEVGRAAIGSQRPNLAQLEIPYAPGELTAVAYRGSVETGRHAVRTAAGDVQLRASVDRSEVSAAPSDLAYVAVDLLDSAGTLWTGQDREVTVVVQGAGLLAGFGSADPATTERFDASTRTTFDGRALAVIRPTGAGTITVEATAPGCAPSRVTIQAG